VERLEAEMQRPGFWDDQDGAARTSAAHARAQRKLKTFNDLSREAGDLDELSEMAAEVRAAASWSSQNPGRCISASSFSTSDPSVAGSKVVREQGQLLADYL
jgi:hypothetical protein